MHCSQQLQQASPNQNAAARNNILRALAANNCGPQYAPYADQGIGNGGLLDRLFGVPQNGAVGNNLIPLVTTYRTICVRGCDGYYFPLSFSTTPAHFETDQQICEAQCPGAQLYYYENPGATPETALSLTGQPITGHAERFCLPACLLPGMPLPADDADPDQHGELHTADGGSDPGHRRRDARHSAAGDAARSKRGP